MTKYVSKDLKVNFKNRIPVCYSYSRKRKIGILGGSFNPAHIGHIHISNTALINLGLDEIWWMVAPQNRLKSSLDMEHFDKRLSYARLITKNISYIKEQIDKISVTESRILINGPSGSGKELIARKIHKNSKRKDKSFVILNGALLDSNKYELELFG